MRCPCANSQQAALHSYQWLTSRPGKAPGGRPLLAGLRTWHARCRGRSPGTLSGPSARPSWAGCRLSGRPRSTVKLILKSCHSSAEQRRDQDLLSARLRKRLMVSGHGASFPMRNAAPCGGPPSLTRQGRPGNGILTALRPAPAIAPSWRPARRDSCQRRLKAHVSGTVTDSAPPRFHIRLICIRPNHTAVQQSAVQIRRLARAPIH
jgi:hypothetical protein